MIIGNLRRAVGLGIVGFIVVGCGHEAPQADDSAQSEYPTKDIKMIVPFSAGGGTDTGARILAKFLEKRIGQQIVVVNREGASGQIGWNELASASPDGYTLGYVNLPALNTVILDPKRSTSFGIDSFEYVANQVADPLCIAVTKDSRFKSFDELVKYAEGNPGTLRVGTSGPLTPEHLAALEFEKMIGTKLRIAHFSGGSGSVAKLRGGHTDLGFPSCSLTEGLRVLGVMAEERHPDFPDVPTTTELGFPKLIMVSSRGIAAPAGTPTAVVQQLRQVLGKVMENQEYKKKMSDAGLPVKVIMGKRYGTYVKEWQNRAKDLLDLANQR